MKYSILALLLLGLTAQSSGAATFAKLDSQNNVLQVIVITDDNANTEDQGISFLQNLYGKSTTWKLTSTNNSIRKNYAGPGATYDPVLDAFIPPKPKNDPAATLDPITAKWIPSKSAQEASTEVSTKP